MKIMGHRGAAGLALENTEQSIKKAIELGVDVIEIDVRKTHDNQLVVCHDDNTGRVSQESVKISNLPLLEAQKIVLNDKSNLLSLAQALTIVGDKPIMIELKDSGTARALIDVLRNFPKAKASICSFKLGELASVRELDANLSLYGLERTRPLEMLHLAKIFDLNGIGLNYWLLNPLIYWRARLRKLDLYVFTVNKPWSVWFIRLFYPSVTLCTDYPNKYIHHRLKKPQP